MPQESLFHVPVPLLFLGGDYSCPYPSICHNKQPKFYFYFRWGNFHNCIISIWCPSITPFLYFNLYLKTNGDKVFVWYLGFTKITFPAPHLQHIMASYFSFCVTGEALATYFLIELHLWLFSLYLWDHWQISVSTDQFLFQFLVDFLLTLNQRQNMTPEWVPWEAAMHRAALLVVWQWLVHQHSHFYSFCLPLSSGSVLGAGALVISPLLHYCS